MLKSMTYCIVVVNFIPYVLNPKSKCSIFNKPVFTLNHLNIPTVNQSKYLGIIINQNNCALDLKREM